MSVIAILGFVMFLTVAATSQIWDDTRGSDSGSINNRPIIGIVAVDTKSAVERKYGKTFVSATFVKYLEQAGARVVPIKGGQPEEYYVKIINQTNGILFPGGAVNFKTSLYGKSVQHIFRQAVKINQAGNYYPLWGTCMGFQIMCYMAQGANLLKPTDSDNATWPLDFVSGYNRSRLLRSAPREILDYLSKEPVTQNQHSYSILKEVFYKSKLSDFFNVISTNKGRKGQVFISTAEAKSFPFYGVQWHPEKNSFNWNPRYNINHDAHAVAVGQYMANFFVSEARKNSHRFPTVKMESENLIQNYRRVYFNDGSFYEFYFIDV